MNPSITNLSSITHLRANPNEESGLTRTVTVITKSVLRTVSPQKEQKGTDDFISSLLDKMILMLNCPFKIVANTQVRSFIGNTFTDKVFHFYSNPDYKEYVTESADCKTYQPKEKELMHKLVLNGELLGMVLIDASAIELNPQDKKLILGSIKQISDQFLQTFSALAANKVDEEYALLHQELYCNKIRFNTDALTSVFSRGFVRQKMEEAFDSSDIENIPKYAFFIDVDNFKKYNENLDHTGGDLVLSWMGSLLKKAQSDFQVRFPRSCLCIGRFGGDEFYGYTNHPHQAEVLDFMRELQEKFLQERQNIEQQLISKKLEDTQNEGGFFDDVSFKKMLGNMPFSVSIGAHSVFPPHIQPSKNNISIDYLFSRASQYTGLLKSLKKRGGLAYNAKLEDSKPQILEYSKGERLNSRRNIFFMKARNMLFFWDDPMKYFRKTSRN